ncbi:MAG: low molecular weight phosphotyrosine protein phosphatase [Bacteroidia bacterium]|nr:low molecular weight phosphotyrosine protein phosphatase [Bacteroidia bacterium]
MKILMVCLGNICRSPLAEGIMQAKIEDHDLDWKVDSAGTSGYHIGQPPDERSILVAKKNNIDITNQRARQFAIEDFEHYDLICAMDSSNFSNLKKKAQIQDQLDKIHMIMNFSQHGRNVNVIDPYYGDEGFETVFNMLDEACNAIISRFKSNSI